MLIYVRNSIIGSSVTKPNDALFLSTSILCTKHDEFTLLTFVVNSNKYFVCKVFPKL